MNRPERDATDDFDPASEDPALLSAAREYLAGLESGRPPDRSAFLARHAAVAAELAGYLDAMELVHGAGPGRPLGGRAAGDGGPTVLRLAGESQSDSPTFEATPLGDYRLMREVGRGGMGQVYEAVQLSLGRRVAVKVLPFAAALDADRLRRFKNEAHAAASLDHPNIVTVYAVGCERGVYFYAMQFIDGRDLAALIRDLRRQAGLAEEAEAEASGRREPADAAAVARSGDRATTPVVGTPVGARSPESPVVGARSPDRVGARSPDRAPPPAATTVQAVGRSTHRTSSPAESFRTAARLALQAAEALHHAHQQGVVHRDLKPANLMVDAAGKLWVTDFGLAQVRNDPRLTTTGALIGTLRYMSPEQASGEQPVDHRTDVYSLGATFYELLALRPAFDGRDRAALLCQIAVDEPPPLRRVNPAIPTDLETIVAKAMAKAPADRYATAQALADDLRRFLDDKPILARRPSLLDKTYKWARRRRGLVLSAVALLLLAVCGLAASTVLIARANARLADEKDKEAKERQRAQDAARKAREVLSVFTQVAEELPDRPEVRPARRKLLETALGYYKDFIAEQGDDPDVHDELVASQWRAAKILEDMGAKEESLALMEQVRAAMMPPGPPVFRPGGPHEDHGKPGPPPLFGASAFLLQPAVQQDLQLTGDQTKAIAALADQQRQVNWGDRRFFERMQGNDKQCFDTLRPEQKKRLRQILWQRRGSRAFGDPDVADALALTAAQRDGLRQIDDRVIHALRPGPGGPGSWPSEEFWKEINASRFDVLTEDQQAKWKEMTGEPFRGDILVAPPPPPGEHGPDGKAPPPP
jgi:serine/threonine protein kinase